MNIFHAKTNDHDEECERSKEIIYIMESKDKTCIQTTRKLENMQQQI